MRKLGITYGLDEKELSDLLDFLEQKGFKANDSGGSDDYGQWFVSSNGKTVTSITTNNGERYEMTIPENHRLNKLIKEKYKL